MLSTEQQQEIIERAKRFFRETIAPNHVKNTKKCSKLSKLNVNPFLYAYLARFLTGNSDPTSIAKGLLYPRVLGTSITTSFGTQIQHLCSSVFPESFASLTPGIDIEFIDCLDGRRKYCQVKAGPTTINSGDVDTIVNKFKGLISVARVNRHPVDVNDMIVGILYGTPKQLSQHYRKINESYPVLIGEEFWYRLTGVQSFYTSLINAIGEVALEIDGADMLDEVTAKLAKEIEKEGF